MFMLKQLHAIRHNDYYRSFLCGMRDFNNIFHVECSPLNCRHSRCERVEYVYDCQWQCKMEATHPPLKWLHFRYQIGTKSMYVT